MRIRLRRLWFGERAFAWRAEIRCVLGSGDCHRGIRVRAWGAGKTGQALQADLLSLAWPSPWGACAADGAYPTSSDVRALLGYALGQGWRPDARGRDVRPLRAATRRRLPPARLPVDRPTGLAGGPGPDGPRDPRTRDRPRDGPPRERGGRIGRVAATMSGGRQDASWDQDEIWDAETARRYDTPGAGMFADDVLGPTVARLAELAASGRALEFAIGTGRVAVPLSQRGVPVAGVELSRPMLAELRRKVDETAIPVVVGDMATATAPPGAYSLVYLVFNTISNLLTQREQVACFRNAARHLTGGGRFVIELEVPDLRRLPPGQDAVVFGNAPGYLGVDTYDVLNQHLVSHHVSFDADRQARVFRSPHRYVWPAELDLMGQLAGFELESRHADWHGAALTSESTGHVSVYRLP